MQDSRFFKVFFKGRKWINTVVIIGIGIALFIEGLFDGAAIGRIGQVFAMWIGLMMIVIYLAKQWLSLKDKV